MAHKYSVEKRIEWLKNLNPNFNNQDWHDHVVIHFSHIEHLQFFKRAGTFTEKINPAKICGIDYSHGYNCILYKPRDWRYYWLQFFTDLRRLDRVIDNFQTKEEVIHHIHFTKEAKTVVQYGNHYFTIGGQHRLCLAKFLDVPEVEVDVIKYVLDREQFTREMKFKKIIPNLQVLGLLSSDYEIDYKYDFFILKFADEHVSLKKKYAQYILKRYAALKKKPWKGYLNCLRALDVKRYDKSWIDDRSKLYLLDAYLLKHINSHRKKV